MDDYNHGGHSKYSMKVHLIFVTKYRKKIFKSDNRANDVKQFLYDVVKKHGYKIIQMETDKNHIHILLEYSPKISISDIVKQLKQYSTYQMWNYHEEYLSKQYWKHKFFGLMDILLVVLVKRLRKSLKSIFKNKANGNGCRVSTRLKACGFTADNL